MITRAHARYLRVSPFKIRQVIDLVRGKSATVALDFLAQMNQKGAWMLAKIIKSAVANAKQKGHEPESLVISKVTADGGPMLKRFKAMSFGRAGAIRRRTAHVLVELDTTEKIIDVKSRAASSTPARKTIKKGK
ncbi:MAG: 50S ribosomal protein L22 [Candidatus Omnitrophota bacterium]|nr:50S ribosomal protein L22 [Candidatus Omnitrophota bacterium]